jgi:hypothetical protein
MGALGGATAGGHWLFHVARPVVAGLPSFEDSSTGLFHQMLQRKVMAIPCWNLFLARAFGYS